MKLVKNAVDAMQLYSSFLQEVIVTLRSFHNIVTIALVFEYVSRECGSHPYGWSKSSRKYLQLYS